MQQPPKLFKVEDVAAYFMVSERAIRSWIAQKKITGFKAGKEWRFSQQDIDNCEKKMREESSIDSDPADMALCSA